MASAFVRTFKLDILLSVIDWLTFNIVFLLSYILGWFPYLEWEEHFATYIIIANVAYIIALQAITISLHHRLSPSARVLKNTSRTSLAFIILYTSFLGMFSYAKIPGFWSMICLGTAIFTVTSIERLFLRKYIKQLRSSGHDTVKTLILGASEMAQKAADIMTDEWNGYRLLGYFARPDSQPFALRDTSIGAFRHCRKARSATRKRLFRRITQPFPHRNTARSAPSLCKMCISNRPVRV